MELEFLESLPELIVKPLVASICGAILGWDREIRGRAAGLRTQMLVCLGACTFTMATLEFFDFMKEQYPDGNTDPTRVIAGVIGGIGFLGAGSIMRSGDSIQGVTTAATVWVVGAIGTACGLGLYSLAWVSVTFAALILIGLAKLERDIIESNPEDGSNEAS